MALPSSPHRDELVDMLSTGVHPVTVSPGNKDDWRGLKKRIEIGVVWVRFVETHTELGFHLVPAECDFSEADFEGEGGRVRLVGTLVLNDVPVRGIAEVTLPELTGTGRLEVRA
ncbi:MAG: MbtH domain protein [Proteobacteria bacterium]|nr:MbtH domain protein [Pseudomonadota bacterium]